MAAPPTHTHAFDDHTTRMIMAMRIGNLHERKLWFLMNMRLH